MDEALRALERAALAAPGDEDAAWAVVQALERAGDPAGARRWLCRLARAGDARAWEALTPRRRGVRRIHRTRRFDLPGSLTATGPRHLVVSSQDSLHLLDARTLDPLWSRAARTLFSDEEGSALRGAQLLPSGEHLVVSTAWEVLLLEAATGGDVARATLPRDPGEESWLEMETVRGGRQRECYAPIGSYADRVVLGKPTQGSLVVVVDTGERPGAVRSVPADPRHANLARQLCLATRDTWDLDRRPETTGWDLETGARLEWSLRGTLLASDAMGAVVVSSDHSSARLELLSIPALAPLFAVPVDPRSAMMAAGALLTREHLVLCSRSHLACLDRRRGTLRWSRAVLRQGSLLAWDVADDVLYVVAPELADRRAQADPFAAAAQDPFAAPAGQLLALDLETGQELWRTPTDQVHSDVTALDGQVLVRSWRPVEWGQPAAPPRCLLVSEFDPG